MSSYTMPSLRILFLIRSLEIGGAERQLALLAKGLQAKGHQVTVAVFYPGGELACELENTGVMIRSLDKRGRWDIVGFGRRLNRLVEDIRPDVFHSYLSGPNLISAMIKPWIAPGILVWGLRASNMDLTRYDRLAQLVGWLEGRFSSVADMIIANSWSGAAFAKQQSFATEHLVVIPNGIDTERYYPQPEEGRRVREGWGVPEDGLLIGHVGRLDPMKDHETFLRAAARFAAYEPHARFVCVGDGPSDYRTHLHALARSLGLEGRLIWAGARLDMSAVYSALDVITSSSAFGEGFPNVLGEAMSCCVPAVATDVGDSRLVVGDSGKVVPPRSPEALAEGWRDLLALPRNERSARARLQITRSFGLSTLVERTDEALARFVAHPPRA